MNITSRYLIAALLAAAPVAASAQTTPPPAGQQREHARDGQHGERGMRRGPGGPGRSPIQGLLRQREALGLTADQVSRLEAIQRDLRSRNQPLHQQLQALRPEGARGPRADGARPRGERRARPDSAQRGERRQRGERPQLTPEQRQQMEQRRAQAQPILQQLRQNTAAAMQQARGVLTAEQQQKVQQRMQERRDRRDGRERGPRGEGRRGGERPAAGARS